MPIDLISLHINPTRFSPQRDFDKTERIALLGAADVQKQLINVTTIQHHPAHRRR